MYTPFHESVIRDQQTSAVADVIEQVLLRDALYAEGAFRQTSGVEPVSYTHLTLPTKLEV